MAGITLRQIRAVIAVCEEGSFTRAAEREAATQSGISQHIAALERALGVKLFERSNAGVRPTPAGMRYYRRCIEAVGTLKAGTEEMRALAGRVTGNLRIGLMPTFTRAALAPALKRYVDDYPDVKLKIVEGYSNVLTDRVLAEDLDFAVVPTFEGRVGLRSRLLARDREMLVSGPARGLRPLTPLRLREVTPLKIVVPGPPNIRRRNIDTYFQTNGVPVEDMIEMDAMIGTLEFVAATDWVAVLPSLICVNDIGRRDLVINPIIDPPLYAEFVVIEPARHTLSVQAQLFLERLQNEVSRIQGVLARANRELEPA
ncbi:MAG TPA: LysR family transcriptional regulator [Xanthobacteraceae bacterium]|nr:LysR family transcriptional regulator [Xanthobacteraceae bacterium]